MFSFNNFWIFYYLRFVNVGFRYRSTQPTTLTLNSEEGIYMRLFLTIGIHRQTRTDQIPVPISLIDPSYRWPELIILQPSDRKHRLLPTVRTIPISIDQIDDRVWCIFQGVILFIHLAI